jgi:hypothetical protein
MSDHQHVAIRAWVVIVTATTPESLDQAEAAIETTVSNVSGVVGMKMVPYLKAINEGAKEI